MAFFQFRQNNSGGSFDINPQTGIGIYVLVEADTAGEANERAESIGIYFNGIESGSDCDCCGDRWYSQWSDEAGDVEPRIYEDAVTPEPVVADSISFIHFKNGTFLAVREKDEELSRSLASL